MDQKSPIHKKTLLKQFFSIFLPFVFIVILLSWAIYYFQFIKTQEEVLKAKEINSLAMQKEFIQQTIKSIISDINVIAAEARLQDFLIPKNQNSASHVKLDFLAFSKYKGIYDQIRVLDETGMEKIRVDLKGNEPFSVPEDQLQFKGNRYYFTDTYLLAKGEIFMSPLDLNIEKGKIEEPLKPMIRFGMPIFDKGNVRQGALIINFLGKKLLDDLLRLSLDSPGHMMLLNSEGYWLKGIDPKNEWGFMFEARHEKKIQYQYPNVWQEIIKNDNGQLFNEMGLMTFIKIFPLKEGIKSSGGSSKAFQKSSTHLNSDEFFWVIVSHILPKDLHKEDNKFLTTLIFADVLLLILLGVFSWQLILANFKRRLAETALKKLNQKLEEKVKKRTNELFSTDTALKKEVIEHRQVINEKRKIESQLRQAQKMEAIGTLAGGIAHDFNNILTPIMGYADIIKMQLDEDNQIFDEINEIISASYRAKDLVQQILTFSRQSEHELRPIRIQWILKEVIKLLRSSIPTTIEIRQDIESDCSPIMADHTQIHQVIMNLCTNAYHSMREKGGVLGVSLSQVNISLEDYHTDLQLTPGKYIKFEVSDSGHGMSQDLQKKIFEPYFTTKEEGEGTGLGLSVVHGIIKSFKGHISVYSEIKKGTTFHVYLPTIVSSINQQEVISNIDIPRGTENILVVDDEKSILKLEKQILEDLGYTVTCQVSSKEALIIFKKDPDVFDLVITDMTMPKVNGAELVTDLIQCSPNIPIILCTGFSAIMNPEKAKSIGISGYITKPISLLEFAKTVRSVLNKSKA